ncbi:MAG: YibE/F family protein [bacterium]
MNIKVKNCIISLLIVALLIPLTVFGYGSNVSVEFQEEVYSARIIALLETMSYESSTTQVFEIEVLDDEYNDNTYEMRYTTTDNTNSNYLSVGNKINVVLVDNTDEINFYFYSYDKTGSLTLLVMLFVIMILIVGGIKGLKALISLILILVLIVYLLIPGLLQGYSPILLSVLICILSTIATFVITNGFTKKTLIALIGVCGGLVIAGLFAYTFTNLCNITGIISESEQMLAYIDGAPNFDYRGLLFAGIIIGALGACMDVAMELTSSLIEIKEHKNKIKEKDLIKSGFNIGKDILGTMVNTLILAYVGGSLTTLLLFVGFEKSFNQIINLDSISAEIIRSISGSVGLLFTIPLTIFTFVLLDRKEK